MNAHDEIYLDNHATTRTDPRVVQAMVPWMLEEFANPGSVTHEPGRRVAAKIDACREAIAAMLGASADDVVFTSGATESINLALMGIAMHPKQTRRRMVSVATEHRAALDPLYRLRKSGWEIVELPVEQQDPGRIGELDLELAQKEINDATALVSVMFGNNEIGTLQPLLDIAGMCRDRGALLHVDASQSVGRIPIQFDSFGCDLMSFSAHKFYGPKGVGGLIVRGDTAAKRIWPQIVGGGQQHNLRSGTLNSAGIIGMTVALELAIDAMEAETQRLTQLRSRLWERLQAGIDGLRLNGPDWNAAQGRTNRLPGNLNVCFPHVEGQSLMLRTPRLAVSSGSACTSAEPQPSHVLRAIGRSVDEARSSIRLGIGRFNTEQEVIQAADWLIEAYRELAPFVA